MILTTREGEILQLHSIGLTPDEIAERLFISKETVRKTISNIKIKLKLQKASELTAYYWCNVFGTTLEEQRNSILKTLMCFYLLIALPMDQEDKRRVRIRSRRYDTEMIKDYDFI